MATYIEALKIGEKYLQENNILDSRTDAWLLLSHVLSIDKAYFLIHQSNNINKNDYDRFICLVQQRCNHIPLQYIIGYEEFMGIKIKVSKDVLIPRQETELLVHQVLQVSKDKKVLDMCTGSGCIIISLEKLGEIQKAVGVDISEKALNIARENASLNNAKVDFVQSDLFENVHEKFDIIVSNPPYIPTLEIENLMPEVRKHEPIIALDGCKDGLKFYKKIINVLEDYLNNKGHIFFEIGHNQGEDVYHMLSQAGFAKIEIIQDLSGLDRIVHGIKD